MKYRIKIVRDQDGTPRRMFAYEVGPRGGKGRVFFTGDCWYYKGYWLLYFVRGDVLYRIWTSGRSTAEVRAWIRWSFSAPTTMDVEDAAFQYAFRNNPTVPRIRVGMRFRGVLDDYFELHYREFKPFSYNPAGNVIQRYDLKTALRTFNERAEGPSQDEYDTYPYTERHKRGVRHFPLFAMIDHRY